MNKKSWIYETKTQSNNYVYSDGSRGSGSDPVHVFRLDAMAVKTLRPIQVQKANEAYLILSSLGCVYIAGQVRSGKSATSLETAKLSGATHVLMLTKKKAMSSIESDYYDFGYDKDFGLTIMNDESMHKLENVHEYDLIIHDEHHRFGAKPKPGSKTKLYREMFWSKPMIFLSGTPNPETYSQLYHQFWVTKHTPWPNHTNFYKWANDGYVKVKEKRIGHRFVKDYDEGVESKIMSDVKPYMVTMTQAESGFESKVEEEILYVDMEPRTYKMADTLMKDLVLEGKDHIVIADTPASLQQKCHQIYSGTLKIDDNTRIVFDYSKVNFIIDKFGKNKIAIFYKFKAEWTALKDKLGDRLTDDIKTFNECEDKWIALQIVSGREGVNLSKADYLIMYNIDFSATSYFQSRDRMTVKDRERNQVFWIFSRNGIEDKVYKAVSKKKNYTLSVFKKDYGRK